ncbi:hypothetical protein MRX96_006152 [Rhipicephalus microplus]
MMQYMKTLSKSKLCDVIALQEPFDQAHLPGYVACGSSCESMRKNIWAEVPVAEKFDPHRFEMRQGRGTAGDCAMTHQLFVEATVTTVASDYRN